MTRRAFLGRSLALGTALALPTVLPGCRRRYERELAPGTRLATLTPWEFVVLRAASARILDGAGPGADADAVVRRADADLATVDDPAVRAGVREVLRVVEYVPVLRGHLRPFSVLAPVVQDGVLDVLARSRFTIGRVSFATVKLFAYYYHYTDAATWPALGYEGPWVGRVALPAYRVDYGLRNGVPFAVGVRPRPTRKV